MGYIMYNIYIEYDFNYYLLYLIVIREGFYPIRLMSFYLIWDFSFIFEYVLV